MKIFIYLLTMFTAFSGFGQSFKLPLWEGDIPNRRPNQEREVTDSDDIVKIYKVQQPTIEVFLPSKRNATGQAVLICPGGSYITLAYDWEGTDIAKWLNSQGIAGIVLKYRLPDSISSMVRHKTPMLDAEQAMILIRKHAGEWNIDTKKVGVMGFSAGGHLASTLGTHFTSSATRPDFMVLVYPVISMKEGVTHIWSRRFLLGYDAGKQLIGQYSNETRVSGNTPPTFLIHSADDDGVPVQNSLLFFEALHAHKVPTEMHIFPEGGHGYGLGNNKPYVNGWPNLLLRWLQAL